MAKKNPKPTPIETDEESTIVVPGRERGEEDQPSRRRLVEFPNEVAVLAVRDAVTFPGTVVPLEIHREKSRRLLEEVLPDQKAIVTVLQRNPEVDSPGPDDLYDVGTAVMVLKMLRMDDGTQNIVVQGLARVRLLEILSVEPFLRARIEAIEENVSTDKQTTALVHTVREQTRRLVNLSPNIPDEALVILENIDAPGPLSDFLGANLPIDPEDKQSLLAEVDVQKRLETVNVELQRRIEMLELSDKIQSQVRQKIDKTQREYFLQEQLKAIQEELGEGDERQQEVMDLRERISAAEMPEAVETEAQRELDRLAKLPGASPEYNVIRTYLDLMCELPWSVRTEDVLDVNRAEKVLNEDHYDLEKVKRRILEYLAVRKLAPESRGPILCFVGPPGVGKTSLGKSIARALGRKFIRMSLGGMRDEAELRGHRRTYIGAMPGRIIQEIRKAGTHNPVFMLDELDKVGADFRGDPTSALLEILDPAQNGSFQDHYLNVPFDLTQVLFIATANYMAPVPPALRDRMEVIELPGYTLEEKVHIAQKYLVPRQLQDNGLKPSQVKWKAPALRTIIEQYTRESGVRELERQIGSVCRALAAKIAAGKIRTRTVNPKIVAEELGPRKYENELALRSAEPGVATGLAYTPTGGTILFIEATMYPGSGNLILTGQIGDVMKESARAALSLVRSRCETYDVDCESIGKSDVHIHVPAGAVPKDGPSAGVAMFTTLMSLATGTPARTDVAMTGEITLRGTVLPIGGVKEKLLAAKRAGIKTVLLPQANEKDLQDVPEEAKKGLTLQFVRSVDEVLEHAFKKPRGSRGNSGRNGRSAASGRKRTKRSGRKKTGSKTKAAR